MAQANSGKKRKLDKLEKEDSDSDYDPAPPPKKKSRKSSKNTRKKQKKRRRGLTKKAANEFKKKMNEYVKHLARMVNRDWHDGWEQQGEELQEYFQYLHKPAMCIYQYVCVEHTDYDKLNEILKNMADSWDNIHAIPFRCGVELGDTDFDLDLTEINTTKNFYASPDALISFLWSLMLYGACCNENIDDNDIYRYIKDATDNDVDILNGCNDEEDAKDEEDEEDEQKEKEKKGIIEEHECLKNGKNRLKQLLEKNEIWNELPTTKKKHKMRRGIDRRYDGELHLRTRDYHLYDNDWF